jgi:flagellar hook-associated protein 1
MSAALNIGARALTTNLASLQVVGHNIANAGTAGYSRQSVQLQSAGHQLLGGHFFGKGVEIGAVTRSHSAHLAREAQRATSVAAADGERFSRLQQLENLFPTGVSGLGAAVNDMLNAWTDVASSPTNLAARVVVLGRADELAARLRETAGGIDALAHTTQQQMQSTVTAVNRLAQDLARVNQHITAAHGGSGTPNDLLDQRDSLLGELSRYVQITTVPSGDGGMSVFVGGSQPLVLGQRAGALSLTRDPADPTRTALAFDQGGRPPALDASVVGGQLGGLLGFMGRDLQQMQNLLGRMAVAVNSTLNTQHRLGLDLNGQPGGDFFVPLPPVSAVPAPGNTGSAALQSQVVDPAALKASDYRVRFDGGTVRVTRLSDQVETRFDAADMPLTLDGLRLELTAGAAASGDGFLLRPFADAARNLQLALGSPDRLAGGSPVSVSPGAGNAAGMGIESLYAVSPSAQLTDPVTLTFLADGSVSVSGLGPDNPPPDKAGPPPSYHYTPGQPLVFNGWSLTLRGNPSPGDSFTVGPTPAGGTPQNAGNARAVLALRDLATFDGVPLSGGYSALLSTLGTQVQGAQFASRYSGQIATTAGNARAAVSGVNLDEEAARLLQFQQAYQASAKFLQIAQGTFDTLLQTVGR